MEGNAGDVAIVPLEGHDGIGVGRLDVVEAHDMATRGSEELLVWGDAQSVDLRLGVLDGAAADAAERFPEADCVVVASWRD